MLTVFFAGWEDVGNEIISQACDNQSVTGGIDVGQFDLGDYRELVVTSQEGELPICSEFFRDLNFAIQHILKARLSGFQTGKVNIVSFHRS